MTREHPGARLLLARGPGEQDVEHREYLEHQQRERDRISATAE